MAESNRAYHGDAGRIFAARAGADGLNALHERPAVLTLIGDVDGLDVADLGCGAGHLAAILSTSGARVTGVEGSSALAQIATHAAPAAAIVHHDLDLPLTFLADDSQDGVVCALVIHHLDDRQRFLGEVRRILRPGGWLVLSTTHPTADWGYFGGSYFDERWVTRALGEATMEYRHMTMSTVINEIIDAGFTVERMVEPQPIEAMRALAPERYERLRTDPIFVVVRARADK
ncbi:methyltransferase domain-containing protein [Microbacterium horticulturae]|uniref:Methyltransferase domain-containing protein n=1 Tax=Microbacterium horticulturae TaxID=3028316 RepID=A0ABY8BUQ2_9MICO|nr:class I SAM-dependent methyltransferase [Microbacterium sp. KACC 23027]WEG07557.1 methyltransferase domain-containing protein [Microbacterium sp. KACC 23027]